MHTAAEEACMGRKYLMLHRKVIQSVIIRLVIRIYHVSLR